jgi:hypothetical protein
MVIRIVESAGEKRERFNLLLERDMLNLSSVNQLNTSLKVCQNPTQSLMVSVKSVEKLCLWGVIEDKLNRENLLGGKLMETKLGGVSK